MKGLIKDPSPFLGGKYAKH